MAWVSELSLLNFFDDPGTTHLAFIPDDLLSTVAFCVSIKDWLYFFYELSLSVHCKRCWRFGVLRSSFKYGWQKRQVFWVFYSTWLSIRVSPAGGKWTISRPVLCSAACAQGSAWTLIDQGLPLTPFTAFKHTQHLAMEDIERLMEVYKDVLVGIYLGWWEMSAYLRWVRVVACLQNKLAEDTQEALLYTEDARDALTAIKTMKEYGPPAVNSMISMLTASISLLPSLRHPKRFKKTTPSVHTLSILLILVDESSLLQADVLW